MELVRPLFRVASFYLFNDCIKDFMIDKEISKENISNYYFLDLKKN